MPVDTQHKEYRAATKRWDLTRSIVNNDATHLIRTVDASDTIRSEQYRKDAILTNFTRLTKIGLTGLVFRKEPTANIPAELQYLNEDATGCNFALDQLCQQVVGEVLVTGRYGLLVDYPQEGATAGKARIKPYMAESIINWHYEHVGDKYMLTMVTLHEVNCTTEDGFEYTELDQWRVLRLVKGAYVQLIYDNKKTLVSAYYPTDYAGDPLTEIPFAFVGSENNDGCVDSIPLYDLAVLNLGHYKNSADVEETSFVAGQAVPVINIGTDTSKEDFDLSNPSGVNIGSRKGLVLNGGDFNFRQVSPNLLPRELQNDKQEQAVAIGARLIAPPGGRETAEAAKIRFASQNSALYMITRNTSDAIELCLYWASLFMTESPEAATIEYELNNQFYEDTVDPNMLAQQIMLFDRELMSADEIRRSLVDYGVPLDDTMPTTLNPILGAVTGGNTDGQANKA